MPGNTSAPTSPEATGGAGVAFEFQVDASFLALLLCGGCPPFLADCRLEALHLQSGHLGWRTDDLLLIGASSSGERRTAAIQVKREFTFQKSDEQSVDALAKAWADFNDAALFHAGRDTLGLVIQTGSADFFHGFRTLLDCARSSMDPSDFDRRLNLPGYLTKNALKFRNACRSMIAHATGLEVEEDRLFEFLRNFGFVKMDLGPTPGMTEACIRTLLGVAGAATPGTSKTDPWPALLTCALRWDGRAQSVTANLVAEEIGWSSLPSSAPFERELASLRNSTAIVVSRITGAINGVAVPRAAAETALTELANRGGVVIVAGEPGVGKSALAGRVFAALRADGLALAFRPGMLTAGGHINQVLLAHGQTAARLLDIGALYPRNLVLIESAERFLETADVERDGFRDLLSTLGADPRWVIVITCRSFAVDTFRRAFLEDSPRAVSILDVPEFTDDELQLVAEGCPSLSAPLAEPRLRRLLRKPLHLRMAAKMAWAAPFPSDLRGFRRMVWRDVVRDETHQSGGMPMRRAKCFQDVVLRRARSLEAYVNCDDLDADVLQALRRDMLVVESPENADALAPADDVLEDWALQHWIEGEFGAAAKEPGPFFERVGTHPAIRRAFRVWLSEWLDAAFEEASAWTLDVVRDAACPKHWVDDVLTAALLSTGGGRFVAGIADGEASRATPLLRQLLHLTRVACRRLPDAAREPYLVGTRALLPEGGAWVALLEWLDRATAESVDEDALPLLLNFLEDWAWLVSPQSPYPVGAEAAGRVAVRLAAKASSLDYSERKPVARRALQVALKVPKVVDGEIQATLEAVTNEGRRHSEAPFLELVLGVLTGGPVARDLPAVTVRCVEHAFGMTESAASRNSGGYDAEAVEAAFGVPSVGRQFGFPPSALHGPYHHLFLHHPASAVELVVRVVNHCCDAYGRGRGGQLEEPGRIELEVAGRPLTTQWINGRLWGLYRSATVGPYALQSALMALENWLLARADRKDPGLSEDLLEVLRASNNVAVTAVVVSVVEAWPEGTWRALLPLLRHRAFFHLDLGRYVADQSGAGRLFEGLSPRGTAEEQVYAEERKKSNGRPHRQISLEQIVVQLQCTEARDEIWAIIDDLRARLPEESERTEDDRQWELVLHRIDLRVFEVVGPPEDGRVRIQPKAPPPAVAKMLAARQPEIQRHSDRLGLLMWAKGVFEGNEETGHDPRLWREKLMEAVRTQYEAAGGAVHPFDPGGSAPQYVAAVCARDHWDELSEGDRTWCVDAICRSVEASGDEEFSLGGESFSLLDGSMAAAVVLPGLVPKAGGATVLRALSYGVMHAKPGFVDATMLGIGRDLLPADRDLATACIDALVAYSQVMGTKGRPWAWQDEAGKREARQAIRQNLQQRQRQSGLPVSIADLDYRKWPWWGLTKPLVTLLSQQPTDALSIAFFGRLAELLAASWTMRKARRRRPAHDGDDEAFHVELMFEVSRELAEVCVRVSPDASMELVRPVLEAVGPAGEEVADFLRSVVLAQDGREERETFRRLWRAFADECVAAGSQLGYDRPKFLRALFLNISWKQGVREWAPIKGWEGDFAALFNRLEGSEELVDAFTEFLRTVGRPLLPDALPDLAGKLGSDVRLTENAIARLELILSSLIYGGAVPLRREKRLREGTMKLLVAMIDGGSSAAYRMRDDFLTPLAVRA